ncbi:MAG: MerR family transcriptional regulator [Sphingopyxis sp.]|nr:MAG: MerR family transcriptional regulator [Sphingopyxis sp.]
MSKDQGAFRTIGELSKELGIKPHILRYWEDQFAVLNPLKRAGARRHYRPEDVEIVKTINRLLNEEGYTIKGARKFLAARNKEPAIVLGAPQPDGAALSSAGKPDENDSLIVAELKSIRDQLSEALAAA